MKPYERGKKGSSRILGGAWRWRKEREMRGFRSLEYRAERRRRRWQKRKNRKLGKAKRNG